jgi:hypothetical protein
VKLDQIWDKFLNSGFTGLLNREVLPYYAFTDDASAGAYTVFTEAALTFKAYQRQMADSGPFVGHPLRPADFTLLNKDFLNCAEFGPAFLEPLVDLFIKLCPNLEVIHLPTKWCSHDDMPFNQATMDNWRDIHGWELKVKVFKRSFNLETRISLTPLPGVRRGRFHQARQKGRLVCGPHTALATRSRRRYRRE